MAFFVIGLGTPCGSSIESGEEKDGEDRGD